MANETERVNAVTETVGAAIADMTAGQLIALLITIPEVIAQRAYSIQCSAGSVTECTMAAYAKSLASDMSDHAESFAHALESANG